ncbi:MAG: LLM class flavin-dependent oxidoreductase [Nannocystaceae bacterium]|nr:LLM class flavin-dependent oxidoreductase [Nannocystaceae bacterium]
MPKLSVLDLAPITRGGSVAETLRNTVELAQHVERLGYHRLWLAEHHGMPGIASAATAVLIGHVAGATSTLRVGAGGIMLPNHAPLMVAEQFGTLDALYPGRIDLGLGRAAGSDGPTARALRRTMHSDPDGFPQDVEELIAYFEGHGPVPAVPGNGANIPVWILGSSLFGAQTAAALGLPYAFASHFAPTQMMEAIALYRERFRPSKHLDKPYVMLGYNVIAADTDDEAALLATSLKQAFVNLRLGRPSTLPPPNPTFDAQLPPQAQALLRSVLSASAIGAPHTVRDAMSSFAQKTGADELIVTSMLYDHTARLRSFELLAELRDSLTA